MSDKSHVTLDQVACIICTKAYDTGSLLPDRRLQPRFEHHTVTGYGKPCTDCQKMIDGGYVALIGVDESKSVVKDKIIMASKACRTGEAIWLKRDNFAPLLDAPAPPDGYCFIDGWVTSTMKKLLAQKDKPNDDSKTY